MVVVVVVVVSSWIGGEGELLESVCRVAMLLAKRRGMREVLRNRDGYRNGRNKPVLGAHLEVILEWKLLYPFYSE